MTTWFNDPLLCMIDTKGRAVWIASRREHLQAYAGDIRSRGERYRITQRTVSALGGSVTVWVMTITPRGQR